MTPEAAVFTEIRECALEERDQVNKANMSSKPLTKIDRRHYIDRIAKRSQSRPDGKNTMILPGYEDAVAEDIRLINDGYAMRVGNEWHANGRSCGYHSETGTPFPIGGEGTITIDYGTHSALVILKGYNGPTDAALFRLRKEKGINDDQVSEAIKLWSLRTK